MSKFIIWAGIIAVLVIAGFFAYREMLPTTAPVVPSENASKTPVDPNLIRNEILKNNQATLSPAKVLDVKIEGGVFVPATMNIKKGDTVKWTNMNASPAWPASAVHPTHGAYPEKGGCIGSKFDACKGLAKGESWSFQFNYAGSWRYHDHLNAAIRGTVNVE